MKQSASGSKNKVFICETFGGFCGYLATMSALAGGADAAYIYEETVGIKEIQVHCSQIVSVLYHHTALANNNNNNIIIIIIIIK